MRAMGGIRYDKLACFALGRVVVMRETVEQGMQALAVTVEHGYDKAVGSVCSKVP